MRIGNVVAPGPVVKLAMTRSSSDSAKASIQLAAIAGRISGKVTTRKVRSGDAPRSSACPLGANVKIEEPRLNDDRDKARRHRGVSDDDRPETTIDRNGNK